MSDSINELLSFQDQGAVEFCFGCGADNDKGLKLKSYWGPEKSAVAKFQTDTHHCGGAPGIVFGGLLASLIDCHACNYAVALAYRNDGREIGSGTKISCVTAELQVTFLKPAPISLPIELRATVSRAEGRKSWIHVDAIVEGEVKAYGDVLVIRLKDVSSG